MCSDGGGGLTRVQKQEDVKMENGMGLMLSWELYWF